MLKYTKILAVCGILLLAFIFSSCQKGESDPENASDSSSQTEGRDLSGNFSGDGEGLSEGDTVGRDAMGLAGNEDGAEGPRRYRGGAVVKIGAERLVEEKRTALAGKKVGLVANHTTMVYGSTHLVDTLLALGVKIEKVFSPEHGFRGDADAGERVNSSVDRATGLPIVSLYGKNKKPSAEQLKGLDVIVFDIQDVGTRHYTYISTMTYVMQACAEQGLKMLILDRPNPNGWYVDGPVLQTKYSSFIGMHQIPIVHGMTVGEYAQMVNGEGWLGEELRCELEVVPCKSYSHDMRWKDSGLDWIPPSPNLATEYAAYLYPALCWLEPTQVSVGRGTDDAFTIVGTPWHADFPQDESSNPSFRVGQTRNELYDLELLSYKFMPRSLPGKSKYPKHQDKLCKGYRFKGRVEGKKLFLAGLYLLHNFYKETEQSTSESFFKSGFEKWPGNNSLKSQIEKGVKYETIYESWQPQVEAFKKVRKKYLLYQDFE